MDGHGAERPGEFDLIARIREILPDDGDPDLVVGPGDDCAAVRGPGKRLTLVTVDALVEDRHFTRSQTTAAALGERLASVNASDVAAMGGLPRWAVLSLVLPPDLSTWSAGIAAGVAAGLGRHRARLVGGNLASTAGVAVLDLTLLGEVEPDRLLCRSGARPGDKVLVTGRLGAAAAGRCLLESGRSLGAEAERILLAAHRRPAPRVAEGRALSASGAVTAAIDVSDGLHADAGHVARASGVDLILRVDALPVPPEVVEAARVAGADPSAWALAGGEDYEILFACDAARAGDVARAVERETGTPVAEIGEVAEAGPGGPVVHVLDAQGREVDPPSGGFDHFDGGET